MVLRDLAVAIADGGDHVCDLGVLRGQQSLFGAVASETTAHRVLKSIDANLLEALGESKGAERRAAHVNIKRIGAFLLSVGVEP